MRLSRLLISLLVTVSRSYPFSIPFPRPQVAGVVHACGGSVRSSLHGQALAVPVGERGRRPSAS